MESICQREMDSPQNLPGAEQTTNEETHRRLSPGWEAQGWQPKRNYYEECLDSREFCTVELRS